MTENAIVTPKVKDKGLQERICVKAVELAAEHGSVSSDDIRDHMTFDEKTDKRVIGSALAFLSRYKVVSKVGICASKEKTSGSRAITVFGLTKGWRDAFARLPTYEMPASFLGLEAKTTVGSSEDMDATPHVEALLAALDYVAPETGAMGAWQLKGEHAEAVSKARDWLKSIKVATENNG